MRGKLSGTQLEPLGFVEVRAGHIVREYRQEASRRFGPVVGNLIRPLVPALVAGLVDGYTARMGRRTVGLLCQARYSGTARITFCHVLTGYRGLGIEEDLFATSIERLGRGPNQVERIVCEVMPVSHADIDGIMRDLGFAVVPRMMMSAPLAGRQVLVKPAGPAVTLRDGQICEVHSWRKGDEQSAAEVIRDANTGALDGQIYPELVGASSARTAVDSIVRGSSGRFDRHTSMLAVVSGGQRAVGVVLCSRIAGRRGFVTELAVRRAWQAKGVGAALLDRALSAMVSWRAAAADLAVTQANAPAVKLYAGRGFVPGSVFGAYYWPK